MQRVYTKIMKATQKDMMKISFWKEIIEICNDVRSNATSVHELSEAEQYFVRATHIITQLGGEI